MVNSCWVCKTSGQELNLSYYRIPKQVNNRSTDIIELSLTRRLKWCEILNIPLDGNKADNVRICSRHFISGMPSRLLDIHDLDWIPTQNLLFQKNKRKKKIMVTQTTETVNVRDRTPNYSSSILLNERQPSFLCRLCTKPLLNGENSLNTQKVVRNLLESLNAIVKTSVSTNKELPQNCCKPCIKKLKLCLEWMEQFRKSEQQLLQVHQKSQSVSLSRNENISEINKISDKEDSSDSEQTQKQKHQHTETVVPEKSPEDILHIRRKYTRPANIKLKVFEIKTLKCGNCFKKFKTERHLLMHKNFCLVFPCKLCKPERTFRCHEDFVEHKKTHKDLIVCHVCGKGYSPHYLTTHFKNHFNRFHRCPKCGKLVKNIVRHLSDVHEDRSSSICEICGSSFKNLKKHMSHHNRERNYSSFKFIQ